MLTRRNFLTQTTLAGMAAGASPLLAAPRSPDWMLGLADIADDIAPQTLTRLHGAAPPLTGTLYRNGPARFRRGASAVGHWFDGDGLVRAWRIREGTASLAARFVDTPKRRLEEALGRIVQPGFGTMAGHGNVVAGPDDVNAANTNVIAVGDRLLALWEGGSAFALDPETLATQGPVTFRPDLAGMPFLAHPRLDATGRIWNLGTSGAAAFIWRLAADASFEAGEMVRLPMASYIHDFTATARHLVIVCQPWIAESSDLPFLSRFAWRPERGTRVLVIDKDDLSRIREYDLPPLFFFHLGEAIEEADGTIRFDGCFHEDPRFAMSGAPALVEGRNEDHERPELTLVTLRPNGRAHLARAGFTAEFPRSMADSAGLAGHRTIHLGGYASERPFARTLGIWDWGSGTADSFNFGERQLVEEFVQAGRWLVGTTLNLAARASELHIFDARRVSDGPLVSWRSEIALPLTFHGNWAA